MEKKVLTFVTTNHGKFEEVKRWLEYLAPELTLEQASLDVPEVQSLDVREVAKEKAQWAWNQLKKPLIIDDGGIYLEKYHQFPGPLTKYVYQGLGLAGFWKLACEDPRAFFLCCLVYIDGGTDDSELNVDGAMAMEFFEGVCRGHIINPINQTIIHKQLPFTHVLVPEGYDKTFADLKHSAEEENFHHRVKAIKKLISWLRDR